MRDDTHGTCCHNIKEGEPRNKNAFFRQDNAGCYHSASTVLDCKNISKRTGISIRRMDFSDPQGGKGPCDRFATTMKNHVRTYVNEGHDVVTTVCQPDSRLFFPPSKI